jgi:5-methylcytosine-specific restriction protein A
VREVPEWIGATDDADIPKRVRLRIWERYHGRCPMCGRPLFPGRYQIDHVIALANGGPHSEYNLQPVCTDPCHSGKTQTDVKQKALHYPKRLANAGIKKKTSRPMPGSKASGWKRTFSNGWEKR